MSRGIVRWVFLATVIALSFTIAPFERPLKPFDPLSAMDVSSARAEEPTAQPALVMTDTPTPVPVPVPVETPVPTSEPVGAESPTVIETLLPAVETPTQTPVPTPGSSPTATAVETPTQTPIPTPEPSPAATAEPTEGPALPALSDKPAAPGASVELSIDPEGGTITSADGRVSVEFPAAAVVEPLLVKITYLDTNKLPPLPDQPFVSAWELEAFAPDRGMAKVESFPAEVTLQVRYTADDLFGFAPQTLRLWTLSEETGEWVEVPARLDVNTGVQTAQINHFSTYGEGADDELQMASYIHDYEVGLHSGTSQTSIPIEVPPGPGGLTPSLALTYDSGRVDSMKDRDSVGSWVGIGWDLTTGSIKRDNYGGANHYFLEMNGVASEIVEVAGEWKLKNEQFLRISQQPDGETVKWTVTDKSGTTYTFGGSEETARYYMGYGPFTHQYYQWDLALITDTHGDLITYTYDQVKAYAAVGYEESLYVRSSYPKEISYADGKVKIRFNTDYDEICTQEWNGHQQDLEVRFDTPVYTGGAPLYPQVTETRYLDRLDVFVEESGQDRLVRKYQFEYVTELDPFSQGSCEDGGWAQRNAGEHRLVSLSLLDSQGTTALYTSTFEYQDKHFGYRTTSGGDGDYSHEFWRPYLWKEHNGFGGQTEFSYDEKWQQGRPYWEPLWTREVVTQKKLTFGADQQDVTTTFDYTEPSSGWTSGPMYLDGAYHGFGYATETDAANNRTQHHFETSNEALTGRELDTEVYGSDGARWSKVVNTWGDEECWFDTGADVAPPGVDSDDLYLPVTDVSPFTAGDTIRVDYEQMYVLSASSPLWVWRGYNGTTAQSHNPYTSIYIESACSRFTHLKRVDSYPARDSDTVHIKTEYEYDDLGNQTKVIELGDVNDPNDDGQQKVTEREFHQGIGDHYIVVPKWEKVWDTSPTPKLLARTYYYYDGSSDNAHQPTAGNLTAVSKQATGEASPTYSTVYYAYDSYGNQTAASMPRSGFPSGGGIPGDVAKTVTAYDPTYHTYPTVITKDSPDGDPPDQTTTLEYDYVLGKVTTRTEPNGHFTEIRYDTFGRPLDVWDNFDSEAYPTKEYEYGWNPALTYNWTRTWQRAQSGTDVELGQTTCYDGFGRQVQTRTPFYSSGSLDADSVTAVKYDSRGLKQWETQPYFGLAASGAEGCLAAVESKPKTSFTYDPLGNVATVTNPDTSVRTETHNGLTTTVKDENRHKKVLRQDGLGHTVTVEEYTGNGTPTDYALYATTNYEYDPLGNLTRVVDALGKDTTIGYDMLGRKTWMDDMDMGYWEYDYDAAGNLIEQTDARSIEATLAYDDFGRLTSKTYSNGDPTVNFYYDSYDDPTFCTQAAATAAGRMTRMVDGSGTTYSCYDERGRTVRERKTIDGVSHDITRTYDSADRLVDLTYPDGEIVRHSYLDPPATFGGTNGQLKKMESITYGTVYLSPPSLTLGMYTADSQPDTFRLGSGQSIDKIAIKWNWRSQGGTAGVYLFARIGSQIYNVCDQPFQTSSTSYITSSCELTTNPATGKPWKVTELDALQVGFNVAGGQPTVTQLYVNVSYKNASGYDQTLTLRPNANVYKNEWETQYPNDGSAHWTLVDDTSPDGDATRISSSVAGRIDAFNLTDTGWPTFVTVDYGYDNRGRVNSIVSGTAQNLAYQYDGVGNVAQISDSTLSPTEVIQYTYDELDRLKTATGAAAPYNYDQIGRITQMGEFGTSQYTYGNPNHIHAVTGAAGYTYSYDANGNMTGARGYTYGYNAENRLVSSPMSWYGSTSYTYDGQGSMVKRRYDYFGQYQWVVYVGGLYEKTWNQGLPSNGSTKYYWAFGRRIAMRSGSSGPSTPGAVSYFLADNLGSTNSVLHSSGAVMQDLRYRPYGWIRRSSGYNPPDKRFTGQQWEIADPSLNMYNYGARFYSTVLGRFLSADPLVVSPGDPQMLDRYAYVRNNPLKYIDPTGLDPIPPYHPIDWGRLAEAGRTLGSWGVPEARWASTLFLIAGLQSGASPMTPAFYMGSGITTYKGAEILWDTEDGGAAAMGTYGYWWGTYRARVSVVLPQTEIGGQAIGTGYVYVVYSYDPQNRRLGLGATVVFSRGEIEAEYSPYDTAVANQCGGQGCWRDGLYEVYAFSYSESYGYPTALTVDAYPKSFDFAMWQGKSLTVPLVPTWGGFLWP
jgi:RHS repeat-associated protein